MSAAATNSYIQTAKHWGQSSLKYLSDPGNALLATAVATWAVSKICSDDKCPTLAKLNEMLPHFYTFGYVATIGSALYSIGTDWQKVSEGNKDGEKKSEFLPWLSKDDSTLPWHIARSVKHAAKVFAACILIHQGLRSMNVVSSGPSSSLKVAGACASIMAYVIDMGEIYKRYQCEDKTRGQASFDGVQDILMLLVKVTSIAGVLKAYGDAEGFAGNVVKFVNSQALDISNGLFAAMFITGLTQNIVYPKKDEKEDKSLPKYIFRDFFGSRSFIRLAKAGAEIAAEYGCQFAQLNPHAKNLDAFIYVPTAIGSFTKSAPLFLGSVKNVWADKSLKTTGAEIVKVALPIIKLTGTVCAMLKFLGSVTGKNRFSKNFGYIKSLSSSVAALVEGYQVGKDLYKAWNSTDDDKNEKMVKQSLALAGKVTSLLLNSLGAMQSYVGSMIQEQGKSEVSPYFWHRLSLAACVLNIGKDAYDAYTFKPATAV